MTETEVFAKFTDERFKALYDRVKRMQRVFFEATTKKSRNKDAGFEASTLFYAAFMGIHQDELLNEAVEEFDRIYPLWFPMPEIMKGLEHIRTKMLEEYWKRENRDFGAWKTKTTKRLKILGFIPTRVPIEAKVFDEHGECVQIKKYDYNFSWDKVKAIYKAKTPEEKFAASNEIMSISVHSTKPLRFENAISGEPTHKRFFHALVKYVALRDFGNELRNSSATDFEVGKEIHQMAKTVEFAQDEGRLVTKNPAENTNNSEIQFGDHTRAQQTAGFYYLLKAAGIKAGLDNRSEFARFLALLSAYKVEEGKSIATSPVYSVLRENMSGDKWFSKTDRELVKNRFIELNKKDSVGLLNQAIELIEKDLETK
ncbi:MAG: hypothetical protein KG003_16290 [Bacteroidetes bacterium]|nr:hypothetical protein [Bacteroidota bacterium]